MGVKKIKEELKARWGDEPTVAICFAILDYMKQVPADQLQMLTFTSLQSAANKDAVDLGSP